MMLWAFSKFEHTPPLDFLEQSMLIFDEKFDQFSNQVSQTGCKPSLFLDV